MGLSDKGSPVACAAAGDFASADATKGLSGRPLETLGYMLMDILVHEEVQAVVDGIVAELETQGFVIKK